MNTYEGWQIEGFYVKRGEKSKSTDKDGTALFSKDQVAPLHEAKTNKLLRNAFWGETLENFGDWGDK